jgi:DNA-binding response OmpR family regulator
MLSRITVVPVIMARPLSEASSETGRLIADSAFLRAAPAIDARSLSKRVLANSDADVLLLDARYSRPSVVYRVIARARSAGWQGGIVLLLDAEGLAMVPVASSVGASDFVLSSATWEEIESRLRLASGPLEQAASQAAVEKTGIQLHWPTHQITFEGTSISLTLREMQLLWVLMERRGTIVTADVLSRQAWGKKRNVGGALIAAYVCSLRKKLAWFGGRFGIQTVRAVGYRFVM